MRKIYRQQKELDKENVTEERRRTWIKSEYQTLDLQLQQFFIAIIITTINPNKSYSYTGKHIKENILKINIGN